MKKFILIISIVSVSLAMNAKKDSLFFKNIHFSFGVDYGANLPEGDFASGAWGQAVSGSTGLADLVANSENGSYYDIYGSIRYKSIGVMLQYGVNSNPFNSSISNTLLGFGYTPVQNGKFIINEYLIGPYLSFDLERVKLEIKLLFGNATNNNYPPLSVANTKPNNPDIETFQNGKGFATCIGAKIKFMILKDRLGIGLGINYIGSDMTYNGTGFGDIQMSIGIFQLTGGLSLDL